MHGLTKIALILILFLCTSFYSQDTLIFLDGKTITGKYVFEDKIAIGMHVPKPMFPKNLNFYYKDDIFSINTIENGKRIIYEQNNLLGKPFTIDQMERFVNGELYAYNMFKSKKYFWMGLGINLGSSFLMTYSFKDNKPFSKPAKVLPHLILPFSTPTILELTQPEMHKIETLELVDDPYYYEGYCIIALSKIRKSSFFGSMIGISTGIALNLSFN
jgi:hypothetical protein